MPTDEYLAAIHDRLGQILDRLPERPSTERPADGTVELTEPKRRPTRAGGKAHQGGGGGKRTPAEGGAPRPAQRASKKTD